MSEHQGSFRFVVAMVLVALGSAWSDARAQAWVGAKGSLDVNLDYNLAKSDKVISGGGGKEFPDAGTTSHQITLGAEYIPIAHLAIAAALPLEALEFTGNKTMYPHPGGGTYDDGSFHTTLTDLRAGAIYQLLEDPIALSPILAFSVPVANYETVGNTVAGRHLKALHVGAALGRMITDALYVQLIYEFSLVEKYNRTANTALQGQNTSDGIFTIGYKLLDNRLDLNLGANGHITHGGITFSQLEAIPSTLPDDDGLYHDAILREDQFLIGGGVAYQVTNALTVSLGARFFVTGKNTQNASVYALGLGWSAL